MPTPNDDTFQHRSLDSDLLTRVGYTIHTTCPPEAWRTHDERNDDQDGIIEEQISAERSVFPGERVTTSTRTDHEDRGGAQPKLTNVKQERSSTNGMSPASVMDVKDGEQPSSPAPIPHSERPQSSSTNYKFSNVRQYPSHTSSFLRAGSKFRGTQQSDRQVYNVEVDIKHVDMNESSLCGYLRIEGLTEDHPTLTTYFEGEIIGPKYTFQTKHESWGATDKTDMLHWARFPAWRPLAKQAKKPDFHYKNCSQRENIFMRWKEYFLVPDHRVREIMGASFEGFYYICFNQVAGTVSGIYFHSKSEKFQQLELKHVNDMGRLAAMEFR